MHNTYCASVKSLADVKLDCEPELIRKAWACESSKELREMSPGTAAHIGRASVNELRRYVISDLAGFNDVVRLGRHKRTGLDVFMCEVGDVYAPTIAFVGRRLMVTTQGDLVSMLEKEED